jgi:hypothetical protein
MLAILLAATNNPAEDRQLGTGSDVIEAVIKGRDLRFGGDTIFIDADGNIHKSNPALQVEQGVPVPGKPGVYKYPSTGEEFYMSTPPGFETPRAE